MLNKSNLAHSTSMMAVMVCLLANLLGVLTLCQAATVQSPHQQVLANELGNATTRLNGTTASRPFYAIAHRVLDRAGIDAAIKHGANALEMDYTAWSSGKDAPGWWADHDGTPTSWGDKAEVMFSHIYLKRHAGANIVFVWLDIKNPNYCDPGSTKWYKCSVHHLQDLARRWLLPVGVRVLYGTSSDKEIEKGAYAKLVSRGLDPAEAIDIDGNADNVIDLFNQWGGRYNTPTRQRVMSKGLFNWVLNLSNILNELKKASQSGRFGRTFGWTMINDDRNVGNVQELITRSKADGLIYGGVLSYEDSPMYWGPLRYIRQVVDDTPEVHYARVSNNDWPW